MVVIAVFAPLIAPYDPNAINPVLPFKGIGTPGHLFWKDDLGRDILSRIIYGSRIHDRCSRRHDRRRHHRRAHRTYCRIFRWMDRFRSHESHGRHVLFPFILLAMILITVLGNGVMNVILAIGIASVRDLPVSREVRS